MSVDEEYEDDADDDENDDDTPLTQTISFVHLPGSQQEALACVVKRTYAFDASGRLSLADEQVPLTTDPEVELDAYGGHKLLCDDIDLGPPKVATDVVFTGSAYAYGREAEIFAALAVGGSARRLRVTGERRASVRPDGSTRFSSPEPFERVAVSFEHAYGGYDEHAHWKLEPPSADEIHRLKRPLGLYAYPRNSAGAGYYIDVDRRRADGALLPQLEDPSDLPLPERFFVPSAGAWIDAPIPGALGWLHHAWYPRIFRFVGPILRHDPPTRPLREIALGEGDDLAAPQPLALGVIHPRALQGAAPGLGDLWFAHGLSGSSRRNPRPGPWPSAGARGHSTPARPRSGRPRTRGRRQPGRSRTCPGS